MKHKLIVRILLLVAMFPSMGAARSTAEWGLAVYEVGSSANARQEQLALRNSLEIQGIPFVATSDIEEATRRPFVVAGGTLANTELTPAERESLYAYVEQGGVLLATQVRGNMFFPLFGLTDATTSQTNFSLQFTDRGDAASRYLNRPEELTISLGDPLLYAETVWSTQYTPGRGTTVLAQYENGAAALTRHPYGRGLAYALGLGFKETTLLPQLARSFEAARQWINAFEPSGDVFRLLLRGLYEENVHPFLLVHTVPEGRETALVLSHDVDARESFRNSLIFAQMEASLGVRSTYFVTTKYFDDDTDIGYYTAERAEWIKQVGAMGFEVESHSVSHSATFDKFPVGSPEVDLQTYAPTELTLFGEIRVSKQLLDRDLGQETIGFRAGYLRFPNELLRVLEESGYGFDSSVSAQNVLTNLPYFGFRRRSMVAEQSDIVVVPVTLDDSLGYLTPETQHIALRNWTEIIRANGENGAITTLLIHPTDTTYKLETERRLIATHLRPEIWIGGVGSMARFWADRSLLRPAVHIGENGKTMIALNLNHEKLPPGQALVVESQPGALIPEVFDAAGEPIAVQSRPLGDRIMLLFP
ncbi:MAG: polysaccharide deacetylase family protein [Gammaproteobacteria bacterium]|nr:polysaccharide deacetylase family protein [Gammaproteobacteria bacterium]